MNHRTLVMMGFSFIVIMGCAASGCGFLGDTYVPISQDVTFKLQAEDIDEIEVVYCSPTGATCGAHTDFVSADENGVFQWVMVYRSSLFGPILPWEILPIVRARVAQGKETLVRVNGTDMLITIDAGNEVTVSNMTLTVVKLDLPKREELESP